MTKIGSSSWCLSFAVTGLFAALVSGCVTPPPPAAVPPARLQSSLEDYQLGVGDRLRITVFDEPSISGEFVIGAAGDVALPLIGPVVAKQLTASKLAQLIATRLAAGYLRNPRVSVDMLSYRPFYILGEVNKPGEYPYAIGLTIVNAVATAQGFTYRANQKRVLIKAEGRSEEVEFPISSNLLVRPGDTIRIVERYF